LIEKLRIELREKLMEKIDLNAKLIKDDKSNINGEE